MGFQIKYRDGETEDATDTLPECVNVARETYDAFPKVFRQIEGIFTGSQIVISREDLESRFDDEDHENESDVERNERACLDAYNFRNDATL